MQSYFHCQRCFSIVRKSECTQRLVNCKRVSTRQCAIHLCSGSNISISTKCSPMIYHHSTTITSRTR